MHNLDTKDRKILSELDFNARQSNSEIGKKVRLSKEVVKYRIDRMMENGLIVRFHTVINYFKLGIQKYKQYHKKTEWVATATGEWDIICGFLVGNINEFDDEIMKIVSKYTSHIKD